MNITFQNSLKQFLLTLNYWPWLQNNYLWILRSTAYDMRTNIYILWSQIKNLFLRFTKLCALYNNLLLRFSKSWPRCTHFLPRFDWTTIKKGTNYNIVHTIYLKQGNEMCGHIRKSWEQFVHLWPRYTYIFLHVMCGSVVFKGSQFWFSLSKWREHSPTVNQILIGEIILTVDALQANIERGKKHTATPQGISTYWAGSCTGHCGVVLCK